jgi:hypothetical protein
MAQIFKRAFAVQSITPDITHHPILQQACGALPPHARAHLTTCRIHGDQPAGVVRALCYNNNINQTRVRLAGMIKVQKDQQLQSAIFLNNTNFLRAVPRHIPALAAPRRSCCRSSG